MNIFRQSLDFLRSPSGFKAEIVSSLGGFIGALALSAADVEPSWLAKSPLAVSAISYLALADNILNGNGDQPAVNQSTGQQG